MDKKISDDELMFRFSKCSEEAFKILYERKFNTLLNRIIYRNNISPDLAEDITQTVLIKIFKAKFTYVHDNKFNYWFSKIAKNCVIDEIKKINKTKEMNNSYAINVNVDRKLDSDNNSAFAFHDDLVRQEFVKLKEKFRHILYLRYYENLTIVEISIITGKNLNTVKSLLRRGLTYLYNNLNNNNYENP